MPLVYYYQASKETQQTNALQKGVDFVKAFTYGFDIPVSIIYYNLQSARFPHVCVVIDKLVNHYHYLFIIDINWPH